jgi:antitoxin VapB
MPLSIKDPETDDLARNLAAKTGETITEAVKVALRERLERERRQHATVGLSKRLLEIGRRCAAHLQTPAHSLDHGDRLFDENGMPR